jgi:hypothetical protein
MALVVVDFIFFSQTSPFNNGSLILLAGLCLAMVTIFTVVSYVLMFCVGPSTKVSRRARGFVTLLIAGFLSYIVLVQSIGQLNPKDVLTLIPFALILSLYILYGRTWVISDAQENKPLR